MNTKKCLFFAVLVLFASAPAAAQPPANDDFDSATVVTSLPFDEWIATYEAARAVDDPDESWLTGATVWYSFTPLSDTYVEANTFDSDYDTVVSVWVGERGSLQLVAVNDDTFGLQSRVRFDALMGTTYYLMVGAYGGGTGGNLHIFMDVAPPLPPPLELSFEVDRAASFDPKSRMLKITGRVSTSRLATLWVDGNIQQTVGKRARLVAYFWTYSTCDGEASWVGYAICDHGFFSGGKADVTAYIGCYDPERDEYYGLEASRTVQILGPGTAK